MTHCPDLLSLMQFFVSCDRDSNLKTLCVVLVMTIMAERHLGEEYLTQAN